MKNNYGILLEKELEKIKSDGRIPSLFLHSCCAPCSSYVLEYLSGIFDITLFYYNPNISPRGEFDFRVSELERLCSEMPLEHKPHIIVGDYENDVFLQAVRGLESEPEGGARCAVCYRLRLEKSAQLAASQGFDYFTTTLSISPHKNAEWLNSIGKQLSDAYNISYLFSDFKKKNGYKRSCILSQTYHLYRQNYCGCLFSKEAGNGENVRFSLPKK